MNARPERQLENEAKETFDLKVDAFAQLMNERAQFHSRIRAADTAYVSKDDVLLGYDELMQPYTARQADSRQEDIQEIVGLSLRENRGYEAVHLVLAIVLFLIGLLLVVWGLMSSEEYWVRVVSVLCGTFLESFLLMPIRIVWEARKHNICIRLFGALVRRVEDPVELAWAMRVLLAEVTDGRQALRRPPRPRKKSP